MDVHICSFKNLLTDVGYGMACIYIYIYIWVRVKIQGMDQGPEPTHDPYPPIHTLIHTLRYCMIHTLDPYP